MSLLLFTVAAAAAIFAIYDAGFRAGEAAALQVPLRHNANRELVQGQVRILAADTRKAAARCHVSFTLVGPDGGDGGAYRSFSDRRGIAKLPAYLTPGRYQVGIRGHGSSTRYVNTEYSKTADLLLVRPDGSYSPLEYLVNTR
ncbi:MAG: hypothetical protein WBD31_09130 [Rubripirellula sp.]